MPVKINTSVYFFRNKFDSNNNKIYSEHSNGFKQYYQYDEQNRLIYYKSIGNENDYEKRFIYDKDQLKVTSIDNNNKRITSYYNDKLLIVKKITGSLSIEYTYDDKDRVIKVENSNGLIEETIYDDDNMKYYFRTSTGYYTENWMDKNGKVIRTVHSHGLEEIFEYDDNGKLKSQKNNLRNIDLEYIYEDNLIIIKDNYKGNNNQLIELDNKGRTIKHTSKKYIKKYEYDDNGNLIYYERSYRDNKGA